MSPYVAVHLKFRTCIIQIELEKIGLSSKKKISFFSDFCLMLEEPQKFSMSDFYNCWKNKIKEGF